MTSRHSALAAHSPADGSVLALAAAGDAVAFDALIRPRLPKLVRIARAIMRDEPAALDVVQEACLRAWRELPRLRDPGAFDAWLGQIVVNGCRSALRGRRRVAIREIPVIDEGSTVPQGRRETTSALADQVVDAEAVRRAFARLRPDDRALLVLHYVEDRPVDEIARTLRIPAGTVKWRLSRARGALERTLEAER